MNSHRRQKLLTVIEDDGMDMDDVGRMVEIDILDLIDRFPEKFDEHAHKFLGEDDGEDEEDLTPWDEAPEDEEPPSSF